MNNAVCHGILFVDDEPTAHKTMQLVLGKSYQMYSAMNVDEGIELLDSHADAIGVILCDQQMPGRNGVELLAHARDEYPHITRLLITGYSSMEDTINTINMAEIFRYIQKPITNIEAIRTDVRAALDYYEIIVSRAELIREKSFANMRYQIGSRLSDLVMLFCGNPKFLNSNAAIYSFVMQLPRFNHRAAQPKLIEYWANETTAVQKMLEMSNNVTQLLNKTATDIPTVFSAELIDELINSMAYPIEMSYEVRFAFENTTKLDIHAILKLLFGDLVAVLTKIVVNVTIQKQDNYVNIVFEVKHAKGIVIHNNPLFPDQIGPEGSISLAFDKLLLAHLIAYNASCPLTVNPGEDFECIISMPTKEGVNLASIGKYWFEDMLVRHT